MNSSGSFGEVMQWLRSSLIIRIAVIVFLITLLLIPTAMIMALIKERESRRNEAVDDICGKWGTAQTVGGPILTVPYMDPATPDGKIRYAHFLPDNLAIAVKVEPQVRYRGIFKSVLYSSDIAITGDFSALKIEEFTSDLKNVLWDKAFITLGITDMRGVHDSLTMTLNGQELAVQPGTPSIDLVASGIHAVVPQQKNPAAASCVIRLHLNGSKSLGFLPLGKSTSVTMNSPWSTPSFSGAFLPDRRDIGDAGFSATWKVLNYNRNFPQAWVNNAYSVAGSAFGVDLLLPVDEYLKITRTVKYAILFLGLTFIAFLGLEIMRKRRLHPIQYLLIGFALCLFYALLLALSEQIGFSFAYLISGVAITAMIGAYTQTLFGDKKLTLFAFSLLGVLYGFLYVILQQEDYSLIMGSCGLFAILGIIMAVTRKVDWYAIGKPKPVERQPEVF
jgi:inner membrane protein